MKLEQIEISLNVQVSTIQFLKDVFSSVSVDRCDMLSISGDCSRAYISGNQLIIPATGSNYIYGSGPGGSGGYSYTFGTNIRLNLKK